MKTTLKYTILLLIVMMISLNYSCDKDQGIVDREVIEKYISDHNLAATELDGSGLFYVIEKPGTETKPTSSSIVTVNYIGELVDGTVFDANENIKLSLQNTIIGWKLGIPLIGESGKIKLLVPSRMAYGKIKKGNIPGNSVLIFEVDLLLFN